MGQVGLRHDPGEPVSWISTCKGLATLRGDVREWIRDFSPRSTSGGVDLVAGGPPCQPFSMGGKHKAHRDQRDMFPAAVEVVRKCQPRAFIIENVKGLTRSSFANYYQYILLQFEFPEIISKPDESWREHYERLQIIKTSTGHGANATELRYNVVPTLVNAANYGVSQRRERVFIGFPERSQCSMVISNRNALARRASHRPVGDRRVLGQAWHIHSPQTHASHLACSKSRAASWLGTSANPPTVADRA